MFSESSRIYDRDFKRDANLAIGVPEVWLVDWWAETVYVSRRGAAVDAPHARELTWHPAAMERPLEIDLPEIFRGLTWTEAAGSRSVTSG